MLSRGGESPVAESLARYEKIPCSLFWGLQWQPQATRTRAGHIHFLEVLLSTSPLLPCTAVLGYLGALVARQFSAAGPRWTCLQCLVPVPGESLFPLPTAAVLVRKIPLNFGCIQILFLGKCHK
ncbi:hypothetical protein BDV33DRAFT_109168 [Aspergillus novoparasiticus]|uniref:Uncharacterized protein n=1 Tax=Aspergillus novoparasiticus TaxID=986946 RepID=A0A5N6EPY5_9EURO|nr:hypothetical protein BDV33DRAFT_109168 [Aspergillus novoparasiticus]